MTEDNNKSSKHIVKRKMETLYQRKIEVALNVLFAFDLDKEKRIELLSEAVGLSHGTARILIESREIEKPHDCERIYMKAFDKVIGYTEIKEELYRIADMLKNSEHYRKLGVRMPAGMLIHGVPGVGKTLMARSLAEASGRKIFYCRKGEPGDEFMGRMKEIFERAGKEPSSIIILDDMDKYADANRYNQDAEEYVTIQSCIDDGKNKNIFVVATANNTYSFPRSLLRPGRFDRIIELKPPKGKDAEDIISHYIKGKVFVEDIDARTIARIMDGRTCAELEMIINEAGIVAGYQRSDVITMEHFLTACLQTIFNSSIDAVGRIEIEGRGYNYRADKNKNDEVSIQHQKVLCHEAGHAVVSEVLCPGSVTLVFGYNTVGDGEGLTTYYRDESIDSAYWVESKIISALGGRAAEEMSFGDTGIGSSSDIELAFNAVKTLVTDECVCGFSLHKIDDYSSESLRARQEEVVAAKVDCYYQKAKRILKSNISFFDAIVEELGVKKLLTGADIKRIRERCLVHNKLD